MVSLVFINNSVIHKACLHPKTCVFGNDAGGKAIKKNQRINLCLFVFCRPETGGKVVAGITGLVSLIEPRHAAN